MIIKEFNIDLENKRLANGYVEDKEALKIWIHFALRTERYKYLIYSWNYGNEINNIIGKKTTKGLFYSEVKRYIEESLLINENIKGVKDLKINIDGSKLNIEFTVITIFGEVDINENL